MLKQHKKAAYQLEANTVLYISNKQALFQLLVLSTFGRCWRKKKKHL